MRKLTLTLSMASALCFGASGLAHAATSDSNNDKLEQAIATLQAQIDDLKQQVKADDKQDNKGLAKQEAKGEKADDKVTYENQNNVGHQVAAHAGENINNLPVVTVAPYIGTPSQYDGSELIVNNPSINDDLKLLQMRQKQRAYLQSHNQDTSIPRLIFSGYVEGQANYADQYTGSNTSDIDLTGAEIDSFIEANNWLSGYLSYAYDNGSDSQANRINSSNLELSQGFVTIGDLDKSSVYSSVGQLYVPFGQYSSFMVSDPMTKTLGRTKARALVVGYTNQSEAAAAPFVAAYAFKGATEVNNNDANNQVKDYGLNAGLNYSSEKWSGKLGASYISSIAESQGMQGDGSSSTTFNGFAQSSADEDLSKNVAGVDVYGNLGYNNYTFLAEYTSATEHFDQADMSFNNSGAKPSALDLQAVYAFNYWRPSYISADFGKSWESLALGLPEYAYGVTYGVSVWRHALVSFQLLRNNGYSSGTTATGASTAVDTDQLGESYNSAMLQLDMYF